MEELLDKISDVTNRSLGQTKFLCDLLEGDTNKLIELELKIKNNHISYCPGDREECEKILAMSDGSGWAFKDYGKLNEYIL